MKRLAVLLAIVICAVAALANGVATAATNPATAVAAARRESTDIGFVFEKGE